VEFDSKYLSFYDVFYSYVLNTARVFRKKYLLMNLKKKDHPQQLGSILDEVLSDKGYLTYCKEYSIITKWPSIVDNKLAKVSTCERIENGVVYVRIASSSWRQEALFHKEEILKRIQKDFGCPTIKEILFY
jgi:predicted nucleic acid-binding Zn ribbon protein